MEKPSQFSIGDRVRVTKLDPKSWAQGVPAYFEGRTGTVEELGAGARLAAGLPVLVRFDAPIDYSVAPNAWTFAMPSRSPTSAQWMAEGELEALPSDAPELSALIVLSDN